MTTEFKFPDVGEGVTEGKLIKWLVSEGDEIAEDQSLAEVETDKAVVEVPSPTAGTILKLHAEEGETIKVGNVITTIGEEGEDVGGEETEEPAEEEEEAEAPTEEAEESEEQSAEDLEKDMERGSGESTSIVGEISEGPSQPKQEKPAKQEQKAQTKAQTGKKVLATPSTRQYARDKDVDIAQVEGTGPAGRVTTDDIDKYLEEGSPEPAGEKEPTSAGKAGKEIKAMPAVRKYAKEQGVNLAQVPASGSQGQVTREDVDQYLKTGGAEPEAEVEREKVEEAPTGRLDVRKTSMDEFNFEKYGDVEREEVGSIRKAITKRMVESKYTAPHVTTTWDARIGELWDIRKEQKEHAEEKGVHLTFMPFIIKAAIGALKEYPYMNSSLDEEKGEIIKKKFYNIGFAVATDHGLMVPVIKEADEKSILELGRELEELADKARDKKLSLDELRGGTFTVTNWGSIGGEYGTPILNFPEVGILGIGRIQDKPVVQDGEVVVEKVLPISLTFDHRVIDGAYGAEFLVELVKHLEDPDLMLIDD